ncbi:DoxX family membrane protein [Mucilaginibacter sp. X5P1]|uniref:DoxX family protein n=1 Tax=Mucilaginibacter sp. X5P1 TaxID=2723088 RepID=UPI001607FACC|nr:DoxX family membrane protein [Mucilaginibacter sp. X5P1]MBB6140969.1 putative membrane protein [Mucilaginibacter sp. X5P1]
MGKAKKISLILLIIGYIAAGINHFRIPAFYISIIPAYLPYPQILNTLAGLFEIAFGLMLIFRPTRKIAAWGIVLMLIAFLPVHIDMLYGHTQVGATQVKPVWVWMRLFFQPVLILCAWWHTRSS